jgi:hypothetical protein
LSLQIIRRVATVFTHFEKRIAAAQRLADKAHKVAADLKRKRVCEWDEPPRAAAVTHAADGVVF